MKKIIFGIYSWGTNIFWIVLDFLPQLIRKFVFRNIFSKFGKSSMIDYRCYFRYTSKIIIGENVTINRGCRMFASFHNKCSKIIIGNNVAIAPEVTFFSAGHDYQDLKLPDNGESIIVGDYVWICGNATILQGVKIGEGAIVAAGSVVVKDVEPYTVVAGNPAKYLKNRVIK